MADQNWRDYFPSDGLFASRTLLRRTEPVRPAAGPPVGDLFDRDDILLAPGVYRIAGFLADLGQPGLYRFQPRDAPGRQFAVLPDTPDGIASITMEIGALGNADRNRPWPVLSRIASRRRVLLHCMQFSNLSVFLANQAGLYGRTWLLWNYEALRRGDFLSSHAISELYSADGGTVRLFDLSFGKEFIVTPGRTDFPSFQAALVREEPIEIHTVSESFGFEYGSHFIHDSIDDFELDAIAGSDRVLLECYGRLAIGQHVVGMDLAGQDFATDLSKGLADAAGPDMISESIRDRMADATRLSTGLRVEQVQRRDSVFRLSDKTVGVRIQPSGITSIGLAEPGLSQDVLHTDWSKNTGLQLLSGGVLELPDCRPDLGTDGLYRLRHDGLKVAYQAIVAKDDPTGFLPTLLETVAMGGRFADMLLDDLLLAGRSRKIVAHGDSLIDFIVGVLRKAGLAHRLWALSSPLSREPGWPIGGALSLIEIGGVGGGRLIDPERRAELLFDDRSAGFAAAQEKAAAGSTLSLAPLCRTPGFSYSETDAPTGLSLDLMAPDWFGTGAVVTGLYREALAEPDCIAKQSDGKTVTTKATQAIAKSMLAETADSERRALMIRVLDLPTVG